MKNIILCEGFDDVYILGYYLFKTKTWERQKDTKISELYEFPLPKYKRQIIEVYKKEENYLAIWGVGGKDSFKSAFNFIARVNSQHPEEGIRRVFILIDRDNSEINDSLKNIENEMNEAGIDIGKLYNNQVNKFLFEIEKEKYNFEIIPMIIPFEKNGALEDILLQAIEETGDEERFIVEKACQYIDNILESRALENYLQHERQIVKSKFSATISVTNPDRSTALFNTLLMSCAWEEKEVIKRHFKMLDDLL